MFYLINIIAQIIGFIAFIASLISYHRKSKKAILGSMLISYVLFIIHYVLIGAYSGCITKVLAIFRNYFIILKDKYKKLSSIYFLLLFVMLYVIVSIFAFDGIISILPLIAGTIYIIFIWNGNDMVVRKTAFFCYFLWLIYNIFVLSIPGIVSDIVAIISTFIAIINNREGKKQNG